MKKILQKLLKDTEELKIQSSEGLSLIASSSVGYLDEVIKLSEMIHYNTNIIRANMSRAKLVKEQHLNSEADIDILKLIEKKKIR